MRTKNNQYLNPDELLKQIRESKANARLTAGALKSLELMVHRIATKYVYYSHEMKKDVISNTILLILEKWEYFDEDRTINAFAYYSSMINNSIKNNINCCFKNDSIQHLRLPMYITKKRTDY